MHLKIQCLFILSMFSPLFASDACRERFMNRVPSANANACAIAQQSKTANPSDSKMAEERAANDREKIIVAAFAQMPKKTEKRLAIDSNHYFMRESPVQKATPLSAAQFEQKIVRELPDEIVDNIAEMRFKGNGLQHNMPEQNQKLLSKILPCIVARQAYFPSVKKLCRKAHELFDQQLQIFNSIEHLPEVDGPFIIGVCGFWAFTDEQSKFRLRDTIGVIAADGHVIYPKDLNAYFSVAYPNYVVTPTEPNEFIMVLYSDGTKDLILHPLAYAQLKKMSNEQIKFCLNNVDKNKTGYFTDSELEQFNMLPPFVKRCIRDNYQIAASYDDLFLPECGECFGNVHFVFNSCSSI